MDPPDYRDRDRGHDDEPGTVTIVHDDTASEGSTDSVYITERGVTVHVRLGLSDVYRFMSFARATALMLAAGGLATALVTHWLL